MPPIQSDSLVINFEYDIRPTEVGPPIRCFFLVFGQMILRKISKIGATRCQILRLKCTKLDFRWGSAPDLAAGAYSAPPRPSNCI